MKRTAGLIALIFALATCLFAVGCAGDSGSADSAITVSAAATAQVTPDKAAIGATLQGQADTQDEAEAAGLAAADKFTAQLASMGVGSDAIAVGAVETEPRYEDGGTTTQDIATGYYDWYGNWISTGTQQVTQSVGNILTGYDYTVHVSVASLDAANLSQVIRAAVDAGAGEFDGLTFTVADRDAAYQQALAAAVEAAHAKAESLAKASSVYVGRVVNLVEGAPGDFDLTVAGDASAIVPGDESTYEAVADTVPIEASVTVSYAIS